MPAQTKPEISNRIPPLRLVLLFIALLACFCFYPRVMQNTRLLISFGSAIAGLLFFLFVLSRQVARTGRKLFYKTVLRPVHYVQFVMHSSIYAYWGWYWREVYHFIPLIIAQLVFAYALDMLVCWSQRDEWILGFGPFPIILSTNLFLWFRDDWFYFQFAMIAIGVLGKEFIKWRRDGKLTHIFNPSAFPLFIASVILISAKMTHITWGIEISTTLHRPPYIYFEVFILGLVVQALFGVTLVTLSAAAVLCALNLAYTQWTGVYHFIDASIPVSVFIGLHLLVTDPATSPRTRLGKIMFGGSYGAGVFVMYGFLNWIAAPEFYDKLLWVPALNLGVRGFDRMGEVIASKFRWLGSVRWSPQKANYVFMAIWIALFSTMVGTGFLTKGTDFPGGNITFWQQACSEGRWNGCKTYLRILRITCDDGSAVSCMEAGDMMDQGRVVPRNAAAAGDSYGHACDLGSSRGCRQLLSFVAADGRDVFIQSCYGGDGASCFILGSLYGTGYGVAKDPAHAFSLFQQSCLDDWWRGCAQVGLSYLAGQGTSVNAALAVENLDKGCKGMNAASCYEVGTLYSQGSGTPRDETIARRRFHQACDLGLKSACVAESNPVVRNIARP